MTASIQANFSLPCVLSELKMMMIGNSQINTTIDKTKPISGTPIVVIFYIKQK